MSSAEGCRPALLLVARSVSFVQTLSRAPSPLEKISAVNGPQYLTNLEFETGTTGKTTSVNIETVAKSSLP